MFANKAGTTKMPTHITTAGIDTAKHKLDVVVRGIDGACTFDNDSSGWKKLAALVRRHRVDRVGIEASGGYEQGIVVYLRKRKVQVLVLQPAQVKAFARMRLQRAKTDPLDAALIAECTAIVEPRDIEPDPRLQEMAHHLTFLDQIGEDIARFKTRLEHTSDKRLRRVILDDIARLKRRHKEELAGIVARLRTCADLARRLDLIESIPGIGLKTAVVLVIRMPELGRVTREEAAALAGLAPFDDASGSRDGQRHIAGGRQRVRNALYAAALPAAFKWNAALKNFYRRLTQIAKKEHKQALTACARKLLVYANAVLAKGLPWSNVLPQN